MCSAQLAFTLKPVPHILSCFSLTPPAIPVSVLRPLLGLNQSALSKLSRFRAHKIGEEEGAASVLAARTPADERLALEGTRFSAASANGGGVKLMSASQREALSARLKAATAAAGDLDGEADDQPPQKIVGTYHSAGDITNASPDGGGRRKLQTCSDGSGVTVTSSEFPLLEGCLDEFEDTRFANGQVEFLSSTGLIVSSLTEATGSTVRVWCLGFVVSSSLGQSTCPFPGAISFGFCHEFDGAAIRVFCIYLPPIKTLLAMFSASSAAATRC